MAYVLGVHEEMNFAIYRNGHLRAHDVVAGFHVIGWVEPEVILASFVDLVGMKRGKLSVRAWITKIKCELARLGLDLQGVRLWRCEVDIRPGFLSEHPKCKDFCPNENECRGNHQLRAAWQVPDL